MVRSQVRIENPRKLPLSTAAEAVLKRMFSTYHRVVIKAELGSGFSGSWVLLVHPIWDAPELPVVVKIAPVSLVKREYRAYQEHIRNKLSGAAEIRSEPVSLPDGRWAGLCYLLVGSGIFEIESLSSFCRHASVKDIWYVLEKRLFKRIAPLWHFSYTSPQFNLQASYDHLLPVNLLLTPVSPPSDASLHVLRSDALTGQPIKRGDYVRLEGFVVTEVDQENRAVTLNLPAAPEGSSVSYRVRFQPADVLSYSSRGVVDAAQGMVTATRDDLLRTYARLALGQDFAEAVGADTLTLPGDTAVTLPNPLALLSDVLSEPHHVRVARVHGDLNMENILIDPDTRDVHLIDFAMARQDHVLHDLLRLETGVVTWLLPEALAESGLSPETVHSLYERLHRMAHSGHLSTSFSISNELHPALRKVFVMLATVRNMAQGCLFAPDDWREYYQGLTLYLLGALKFKNLDNMPQAPLPKQVAFWGAASAQWLLREQPSYEEMTWQSSSTEFSPFIAGPPILHPRQFFGREQELKRLFNLWKRTPLQNAAIIGPRRSGKTSLLLYLKSIITTPPFQLRDRQRADWLPTPERYRWIFVDFQDSRMGSQRELLGYLLACMDLAATDSTLDSLSDSRQVPCDLDDFMDAVSLGLRTPTIILMDEIGVALQRYPELDVAFWESLRSLATNYVGGNLAFVLAAHESPGQLAQRSNVGSPFFNIFGYTATLGPLASGEARELIASSPIPFPLDDVDWILDQSMCWPILLQILCRERLFALEEEEPDDAWREEGLRQMDPFLHLLASAQSEV